MYGDQSCLNNNCVVVDVDVDVSIGKGMNVWTCNIVRLTKLKSS